MDLGSALEAEKAAPMTDIDISDLDDEDLACANGLRRVTWGTEATWPRAEWPAPAAPCPSKADASEDHLAAASKAPDDAGEVSPDLLDISNLDDEDLACLGMRRERPRDLLATLWAEMREEYFAKERAALEAKNKAGQPQIDPEVPAPPVIERRQLDSPLSTMNGAKALPAMKQTATLTAPADPIELERWLNGIVRLKEGAALRGVHPDTLRREAIRGRVKLIQVSERAVGIRRRDALMLGDQKA
jgi:hypothetical protein